MIETGALITAIVALWGAYQLTLKAKDKVVETERKRYDYKLEQMKEIYDHKETFLIEYYERYLRTIKRISGVEDIEHKALSESNKTDRLELKEIDEIRFTLNQIREGTTADSP